MRQASFFLLGDSLNSLITQHFLIAAKSFKMLPEKLENCHKNL